MDTQKNRLHQTVLLSTQNICQNLLVRNYLQFYAENLRLSTSLQPDYYWRPSFASISPCYNPICRIDRGKSSLHCPACCWCKTRVSYFIKLIYFYNQIIIGGLVSLLYLLATNLSVGLIVVNHHYTVQRVAGVKQGQVILLN